VWHVETSDGAYADATESAEGTMVVDETVEDVEVAEADSAGAGDSPSVTVEGAWYGSSDRVLCGSK
jgi:hypothetical protein